MTQLAPRLLLLRTMKLDTFLKRNSWMAVAPVVALCSGLAANAVAHMIAATALGERSEPIRRPARPWPAAPPASVQSSSASARSGQALVDRNIFCSACVPKSPGSDLASVPADPDNPPLTALPLRLVATSIWPLEARSFATIRNTSSSQQGAYRLGEEIPGAGKVTRIVGKYVDFENEASRQIERIPLLIPRPPTQVQLAPPPPPPPTRAGDRQSARAELLAAIDAGVRKLDDDSFEIDRALVAKLLANPMAASRGARVVPSVENGQPNGFKLSAVRPTSIYAKIGFQSGDIIHAVNGFELNSMDKALEVYTKVREASSLSVSITRRKRPLTLDYTIR